MFGTTRFEYGCCGDMVQGRLIEKRIASQTIPYKRFESLSNVSSIDFYQESPVCESSPMRDRSPFQWPAYGHSKWLNPKT
jgi:hypothetical protein